MPILTLALLLAANLAAGSGAEPPSAAAPAPARDGEGRLLVLNKDDDSLMVFDVPSHRLLATVRVGGEPHEVVVTPDGRKAYTSNVRDKSVSVVDLDHYKVTATLKPDRLDVPHGMGITPDGKRLLVTSEGSRRLYLIDVARDAVERSVTTSQAGSHMVALASGGRRAWIANRGSESLSLYELPAMRLVKTVKVGPGPEGIGISPNGRWVVAGLQKAGQVVVVDAAKGQVITRMPAGQIPIRVVFSPKAPLAIVSNRGSDDVTILDLAAREIVATVPVGRRPGGIAVNARGSRAYVCNNASNDVSILSIPGYEVTGTLPVGRNPDGIAFAPWPAPAKKGKGAEPAPGKPGRSRA